MKQNDSDVKFLPTLATACCVLHNICETHGDEFDEQWFVSDESMPLQVPRVTFISVPSGDRIRHTLCDYFDAL